MSDSGLDVHLTAAERALLVESLTILHKDIERVLRRAALRGTALSNEGALRQRLAAIDALLARLQAD